MPFPIRKNQDSYNAPEVEAQDLSSLIPLLNNPMGLLQQIVHGGQDRKDLKDIWLNSETKEDKSLIVSSSIDGSKIQNLKNKGLLKIEASEPVVIRFTKEGTRLLNESILSDEKCSVSFTKQASKELVDKNSYDFGEEVLVKLNHPEKYGSTKYISVKKENFKKKASPIKINSYDIKTRDENGEYRTLDSYSEEELIQILHLSKNIIDNQHNIRIAGNSIKNIPIHRIKNFAQFVLEKLNEK